MKINNLRVDIQKVILPIITIGLMAFFFVTDGVVWGGDTQGYLNMDIGREAGYSLFLRFFLLIFGETGFVQAAVIFQLILWGVSMLVLTGTVAKLWDLQAGPTMIVWAIQVFFLLLLKYASGLGAVYANTLLTEGITYPVYFLYFKTVLQLNREYSHKRMLELLVYCSILTFIRTQLAVTFMAVIFFWLIKMLAGRFPVKRWLGLLFGCLAGAALVAGGQKLYTYVLYGMPQGTVGSGSFFMTSGLYNAVEEDEDLYETAEDKRLFLDLYELSLQKKANYRFMDTGIFLPLSEHYSQNFDKIKFEVVSPYFYKYFSEMHNLDEVQIQIEMDKLNRRLGLPLFLNHLREKAEQFFQECLRGYMRTAAKGSFVFLFPVFIIYLVYLCFLVCNFRLKERRAEDAGWSALFVMVVSTGNIMLTAFMIFCEPRYVLYNMAPFYITGYLLVLEIYRKRKEENIR